MLNFLLSGELRISRAYSVFLSVAPVLFTGALLGYVAWRKNKAKAQESGKE